MLRLLRSLVAILLFTSAFLVPGLAAASAATQTTMTGVFYLDGTPGSFTVDSGALASVCPNGETTDDLWLAKGAGRSGHVQLVLDKTFRCDAGSTFTLQLTVQLNTNVTPTDDHFAWAVIDATGSLAGMHGAGTGFGAPLAEGSGVDTYSGTVSLP